MSFLSMGDVDLLHPPRELGCLGCLGVMLARNQGSATMNPPGVAGHAGGIRGPSPGADVEARACRRVPVMPRLVRPGGCRAAAIDTEAG